MQHSLVLSAPTTGVGATACTWPHEAIEIQAGAPASVRTPASGAPSVSIDRDGSTWAATGQQILLRILLALLLLALPSPKPARDAPHLCAPSQVWACGAWIRAAAVAERSGEESSRDQEGTGADGQEAGGRAGSRLGGGDAVAFEQIDRA